MNLSFIIAGVMGVSVGYVVYQFLSFSVDQWRCIRKMKQKSSAVYGIKNMMIHRLKRKTLFLPGWFLRSFTNDAVTDNLLIKAGNPLGMNKNIYNQCKQAGITTVSWILFFGMIFHGEVVKILCLEIICIFCIIFIPDIILKILAKKRSKNVDDSLPQIIDMLSMSVDAGMNFYRAYIYVGTHVNTIIGNEMKKSIEQMKYGFSMDEALQSLTCTIDSEELNRLVSAIKQAKKLGVSIAETLKIQSHMMRVKRKQKAEEISKTASIKITLPLVFFIFPALLILYIGPAILTLLYS